MRRRGVPVAAVLCLVTALAAAPVAQAASTTAVVGQQPPGGARSAAPRVRAGAPWVAQTVKGTAYSPVVAQALSALGRSADGLPLGAPTSLPPEPPSHTYLTARTYVTSRGWSIEVLKADQPYAVNNPAIGTWRAHAVAVARFGVARVPAATSSIMPLALWRYGLRARELTPAGQTVPLPAGSPIAQVPLGTAITAALFRTGADTDTLVWYEGDWTLSVMDTTRATATAIGRAVVAYLHRYDMPPYPGLVTVGIGVHGVYTRIDWRVGATLYYVDNDLRAGDNPVSACAMAVTWLNE